MDSFVRYFILGMFLLGPIALPMLLQKWRWLWFVVAGYVLYLAIGINLYFTEDIQDYGTAYGIFIVPYLMFITFLGYVMQRVLDKKLTKNISKKM
ncbi:hypothetical protein M9R32_08915 [Paenisporosarcina quisquiliarum]|uniref:Uncharacterized protein n=1 Tax=Paenisporosarcina quisquiliarum TaxID=365346 RepID=A0A9X3RDN9_9BACL|nr:hypothetical protein [Paenisporosarcina quisquiliarum]MCZ8537299.1 hypothetical protein [Paenisporosarcina quisquiliarum]